MAAIPDALQLAERSAHASAAGQTALFGGDERSDALEHKIVPLREWTKRERLEAERESLGLYLTGHPFQDFAEHCKKFARESIAKVIASMPHDGAPYHVRKEVILAGVVMDVRKRGPRVSIVLDDDTERIEVTMFEDVYAQCKHLIVKHAVLIAEGQLRYDDFINGWRQTARRVRSADEAIQEYARRITIRWPAHGNGATFLRDLQRTLQPFRGGKCEVCIQYASRVRRSRLDARGDVVRAPHARAARSTHAPPRRRPLPDPLSAPFRLTAAPRTRAARAAAACDVRALVTVGGLTVR